LHGLWVTANFTSYEIALDLPRFAINVAKRTGNFISFLQQALDSVGNSNKFHGVVYCCGVCALMFTPKVKQEI